MNNPSISQPLALPLRPVDRLDDAERGRLAKMVMALCDHWKLKTEQRLSMLGLSSGNRAVLSRYSRGDPLAANRDLIERAGHLLGIHKSLRLLFPQNTDLAYGWMTTKNRAFGGHTPVEIVEAYGLMGLHLVRHYLDIARGR